MGMWLHMVIPCRSWLQVETKVDVLSAYCLLLKTVGYDHMGKRKCDMLLNECINSSACLGGSLIAECRTVGPLQMVQTPRMNCFY